MMSVLLMPLACPAAPAQDARSLRSTLNLSVPMPPAVVQVDGKSHLVHELHMTSFTTATALLKRIEILDGEDRILADLQGAALTGALGRVGGVPADADVRAIAPGGHAVAYFWLALADGAARPLHVVHRLELELVRAGKAEPALVENPPVALRQDPPIVLHPPLRGGPWAAVYEPSMERGHRRVFYAIDGRARLPARFAIDWVKVDETGKKFAGDEADLADWPGYGAEVLAVADAVVASTRDDMAESTASPDGTHPRNPPENASGNYIALDLGKGRFAFYEHLKPGSVLVQAGDKVRAGQPIAAMGSTGDSTSPHLHFHVSDANSTLAAEGLPYVVESFEIVGAYDSIEAFREGAPWKRATGEAPRSRNDEMPGANFVVRFR